MTETDTIKQYYEYDVAGCATDKAPVLVHIAMLSCPNGETIVLPERLPFKGEWGENETVSLMDNPRHLLPTGLHIIYLSLIERKFYIINDELPKEEIEKQWNRSIPSSGESLFEKIIVGMSPYGGVGVWLSGSEKEVLIYWSHGSEISIGMEQFLPQNPSATLKGICDFYVTSNTAVKENLRKNGLPSRDLFDNYMKQFTYRYVVLFGFWDEVWRKYDEEEKKKGVAEFEFIEEALFDGTYDKLHDGELMNYHQAGKPKKLAVKWHIKKSEYTAYFWFEDEEIRAVFDRFYGAHPETKTDFMIRIDSEKKKFELALYRYGLNKPQVISESAYQLIVFKNKFEYIRSENYNQPPGAWIW